ncbi:MAG: choline dehydrogenase [Alphaproteobacteria bacterium]|nr:choline dehydrogenase [Alphaproteobacteria bacterium]
MAKAEFDFIIAGGGSAGCVLANRLSADPGNRVLLLEAGPKDRHLWIKLPIKFRDLMSGKYFNWGYSSEPEAQLENRRIDTPRGKVLGGSSSINGMIYCRCHPADFDHWRQLGLSGWGYADVLPYFKRSERFPEGENIWHGAGGELTVSRGDASTKQHKAFVAAGVACGHGATDDHNGAMQDGFGPADYTINNSRRASTSQAFLKPVLSRPNLTVITGAHATRVLIEKGQTRGVEYVTGRDRHSAYAAREVIVSGGAYNSPQLLMLSGIGPADHLREHGIETVVDAPDTGRNLQDHIHVAVAHHADAEGAFDRELRLDRLAINAINWMFFNSGPFGTQPVAALAYIKTREGLAQPDIELLMNRVNPAAQVWFPGWRKPAGGFLGSRVIMLHPESRGSVTLRSADPFDKPVIRHNHLTAQKDIETLRDGVKRARELFEAEPLKSMSRGEFLPGPDVKSDTAIDAYNRATASTIFHPASTCRMGIDKRAVVDAQLRVNGVAGLRVIDASVMPTVPGGHTNAPTIMIAEKAADMILGKTPLAAIELPRAD